MSADNWTNCPRCAIGHNADVLAANNRAEDAYGKIPVDEWKGLEEAARLMNAKPLPEEFREDYEIGLDADGVVRVSYSGGCTKCGLNLNFKHEVPVEGINEPVAAKEDNGKR